MQEHREGEVWQRRPALERSLRDGVLLIPAAGSVEITKLNGSAAAVWRGLDHPQNADHLATRTFPSIPAAAHDVTMVMEDLARLGLVDSGAGEPNGSAPSVNRETTVVAHARQAWSDLTVGGPVPGPVEALFHGLDRPDAPWQLPTHQDLDAIDDAGGISLLADASLGDGVAMSPTISEELAARHEAAQKHALRLDRLALDVAHAFAAVGIESLRLKGLATSYLDHPTPSARSISDADLLVRHGDFGRALEECRVMGLAPIEPVGRARRSLKSVTLSTPDGFLLDLHQRLWTGALGFAAREEDLFGNPSFFVVGGTEVRALRPELRLIHVLGHHLLTASRVAALWDAALLLPKVDQDVLVSTVRRWRHESLLRQGLELLRSHIPTCAEPAEQILSLLRPTSLDRLMTGAARTYEQDIRRRELALVIAGGPVSARIAYAWAKGFPGADYLPEGRSTGGHWRRGARQFWSRASEDRQ